MGREEKKSPRSSSWGCSVVLSSVGGPGRLGSANATPPADNPAHPHTHRVQRTSVLQLQRSNPNVYVISALKIGWLPPSAAFLRTALCPHRTQRTHRPSSPSPSISPHSLSLLLHPPCTTYRLFLRESEQLRGCIAGVDRCPCGLIHGRQFPVPLQRLSQLKRRLGGARVVVRVRQQRRHQPTALHTSETGAKRP